MGFNRSGNIIKLLVLVLVAASAGSASARSLSATAAERNGTLAVIKGVVRDDGGSPIADATVAIFKAGTSKVLKQVRSAADGSFIARILPGTYTIFAVAQGYNPVTLSDVEVNNASQLNYGFKLERAGSGNTLPERRPDRNNPKWVIRSAQTSRSIYQNTEGDAPVTEERVTVEETPAVGEAEEGRKRRGQSVVETYVA